MPRIAGRGQRPGRSETFVDRLARLIEEAHARGDVELSSGGAQHVVCRVRAGNSEYVLRHRVVETEERVHLSPREQEILRLISNGRSNQSIARILEISQWTVSTHLRRIYSKLRVHTRAEAVALALRSGYLDPRGGSERPSAPH